MTPAEVFRPVGEPNPTDDMSLLHQPSGRHFDLIIEGGENGTAAATMHAHCSNSPSHVRTLDMNPTGTTSTNDEKPQRPARAKGGGWACGRRSEGRKKKGEGGRLAGGGKGAQ